MQVGSLAGDATWAILGLAGIGLLLQLEQLRVPLGIAGALYLLWLAIDSWRAARQEFCVDGSVDVQSRRALRAGVILSMTNPQNVAYWAALGSALGAVGVSEPSTEDYIVFFVGFMVSSLAWALFCAAAMHQLFKRASTRWVSVTYQLCAAAFLALALGSMRSLVNDPPATTTAPAVSTSR